MLEWINQLETSAQAGIIASMLALFSAMTHSVFGVLQKSREDPFLVRAGIDFWFFAIWLPIVLTVIPWPTAREWWLIAGVLPVHTAYKLVLAAAYRNGEFTVIYPIARGTAPLLTAIVAGFIFHERLAPLQWFGVVLVSAMIMAMSIEALRRTQVDREKLPSAIFYALITGALIMCYSIYDAYGVRESRSALIFLGWFYVVDGFLFPIIAVVFRHKIIPKTSYGYILRRGLLAAPFGIMSFTAIFLATRMGQVGEVIAIRETSVIFAAILGYFLLGERVTPLRFLLIALIAVGAIMIEIGGIN